ncbi:multiprotein-bridging factor 1 [Coemansia sp. Benny D115]|nr:multiprotein-bridging factor 1 [Coemansia sp. Benny D115]
MSHIDKTIYISKPQLRTAAVRTSGALNAAARSGNIVATELSGKVSNKAHHVNTDHRRIAELDRSDDVKPPPTVKLTVSNAIKNARMEKSLTQKQLSTLINEKDSVVRDYESGKGIPNQQILSRMERVLGVKLRGNDIGSPLPTRGAKKA